MTVFSVSPNNDFHSGWIAYLLGEPAPKKGSKSMAWLEGWNTAFETASCRVIGEGFQRMRELGHVKVKEVPGA